jgi:hypothetical protein
VIFIEINIIYSYEDLKHLLLSQDPENSYYLLGDDIYFEKMNSETVITREVLLESKKSLKQLNVMKYIKFKTKNNCSVKEVYWLINELRKKVKVITSIFNPINCECLIIIVSNNNDSIIEKQIQEFCEGGALWDTDQIYD